MDINLARVVVKMFAGVVVRAIIITALVIGAIVAIHAAAHAAVSVPQTAQKAFCWDYAKFGDTPSYRNLTTVHRAAGKPGVKSASVVAYRRFETDLLAGKPRKELRVDNARVYKTCGQ